jgi:uncharacterized protein
MSELLRDRFQARDASGSLTPKRMLALDGGGVRGGITIGILKHVERLLAKRFAAQGKYLDEKDFRLAHYYDMIGGTSVGSMIATMLALGMSVAEVERHFRTIAPVIFRRPRLSLFRSRFRAGDVKRSIDAIVGADVTLGSDKLTTGLCIVAKRADTGSTWPMFNNPDAYYYGPGKSSYRPNKDFKLSELIRASTAAPSYFLPKTLRVFEGPELYIDPAKDSKKAWMIDGGVSPHNNPALQLFMMAGMRGYRMGGVNLNSSDKHEQGNPWNLGADNLLITSVGTGRINSGIAPTLPRRVFPIYGAAQMLTGVAADGQELGLAWLQWMSRPHEAQGGYIVDSEVGDLRNETLAGRPLLTFARYDMDLRKIEDVGAQIGRKISAYDHERLQNFVEPRTVSAHIEHGEIVANKQVQAADFPAVFDHCYIRR